MIDVPLTSAVDRQAHTAHILQERVIVRRVLLALRRPLMKMRQLYGEQRRLERVQPEVPTDQGVVVLWRGPMTAHHAQARGEDFIMTGQHAAISKAAQVLCGEEAKAPHIARAPGVHAARIARADGLRRIFNKRHIQALTHLLESAHVGHLPKEMHGDDGAGFL